MLGSKRLGGAIIPLMLAACVVLSTGCLAAASGWGVSPGREQVVECNRHCNGLDMNVGAIVIVRSSIGCVCEPRVVRAEPTRSRAAMTAAAGAVIADDEAQQREQQR